MADISNSFLAKLQFSHTHVCCSNLLKPCLAALSAQLTEIIGAAGEDLSAAGQHQGVPPARADTCHLSNIGNNLHA